MLVGKTAPRVTDEVDSAHYSGLVHSQVMVRNRLPRPPLSARRALQPPDDPSGSFFDSAVTEHSAERSLSKRATTLAGGVVALFRMSVAAAIVLSDLRGVVRVDRFERVLALLRCGQSSAAAMLRAEDPGAWLPHWSAGEPLSPALRQVHQLGGMIRAVHVDDRYAWAMARDRVFRISCADGHMHQQPLQGPHEFYWEATFAGETVVAIDEERLLVWNVKSGERVLETDVDDVPRRAGRLRALGVGGGVAVAGTEFGYLLQWDLADGTLLAKTAAFDCSVNLVAISGGQQPTVMSTGGDDPRLRFHELAGLRPAGDVALPEQVSCGGWTTLDGQLRAVTIAGDGLLAVWDPATTAPVARFPTTMSPTWAPVFSPDGASIIVGNRQAVHVFDLRDGFLRGTMRTDFTQQVAELAAHGSAIYAAQGLSTEGRTNLLELTDPPARDDTERSHFLDAVTATVHGKPVIIAVDDRGPLEILDTRDGHRIGERIGKQDNRYKAVGGRPWLATITVAEHDQVVVMTGLAPTVVDLATGQTRSTPQPSLTPAALFHVAARDGLIAALDAGGTIATWDATTLALHGSTPRSTAPHATSLALGSLHGRSVVLCGTASGAIRWFDATDLTEITPPGRFAEHVEPADFTPDRHDWPGPAAVTALAVVGSTVISAVGDQVTGADITSGEPRVPLLAHPAKVLAMTPAVLDGRLVVATSCADRTLRIWDIATGRETLTIALPRPVRQIVSFTADQITILDNGCLMAVRAS
jgi:WD40 repeat protein